MPKPLNIQESKGAKALVLKPGTLTKINERITAGDPIPSPDQFDKNETDKGVEFSLKRGFVQSIGGVRFAVTPQFSGESYSGSCEIGEGTLYIQSSGTKMHDPQGDITFPYTVSASEGSSIYFEFEWDHRQSEIGPGQVEGTTDIETRWEISNVAISSAASLPDASVDWDAESATTYLEIAQIESSGDGVEVIQILASDIQPPPPARRHQHYSALEPISTDQGDEAVEFNPMVGVSAVDSGDDCVDLQRTTMSVSQVTRNVYQGVDANGAPKLLYSFVETDWSGTTDGPNTYATVLKCSAPRMIPQHEDGATGGTVEDKGKNFEININTGNGAGAGNESDGDDDDDNDNKVPKEAPKPAAPADPADPPNVDYHTRCRDSDGGVEWTATENIPADKVRTDLPELVQPASPGLGEGTAPSRRVEILIPPIPEMELDPDQPTWTEKDESARIYEEEGAPFTIDGFDKGELSRGVVGDWWWDNANGEWYKKMPSLDGWGEWEKQTEGPPWIGSGLIDHVSDTDTVNLSESGGTLSADAAINSTWKSGPAESVTNLSDVVNYAYGGSVSVDVTDGFDDIGHTTVVSGQGDNALISTPDGLYVPPNPIPLPPPVISVSGKTGAVELTLDDIEETTDKLHFDRDFYDILKENEDQRHDHPNKHLLDNIVDTGDGGSYWANDGTYKTVPSVDQVNGYSGPNVTLDADDISETTDHNWLTDAEKTAISDNTTDRHSHPNKDILDNVIDTGDGSSYWADDGTYKAVPSVDQVNGYSGPNVTLDADDIAETTDHNWLTDAEKTNIASNTTDRHSHPNKDILDNVIDTGDGTGAFMNDGTYKVVIDTVNNKTGPSVTLNADDIAETTDHNWLTDADQSKVNTIIDSGDGSLFLANDGTYRNTATDAPVDSVNGHTGIVVLDADDIAETTDHNWLTDADQSKVDLITDTGDGSLFLDNAGIYRAPTFQAPVDSVNTHTGAVVLDADDIAETTDHNWLTDAEKTNIADNTTSRHDPASGASSDSIDITVTGQEITGDARVNDTRKSGPEESGNSMPDQTDFVGGSVTVDVTGGFDDAGHTTVVSGQGDNALVSTPDGLYVPPNPIPLPPPVITVNGYDDAVFLDLDDIPETATRKHYDLVDKEKVNKLRTDGDGNKVQYDDGGWDYPPVMSVNNYTGSFTLDADDIAETTDHSWLTDSDKAKLDSITDAGDGDLVLNDKLQYIEFPPPPVTSVNAQTDNVVLDADDIAETTARRYISPEDQAKLSEIREDTNGGSLYLTDKLEYTSLPVSSVNSYSDGDITLDADDIAETTDHNWLTDAEKTNIADNTTDRHNHSNKSILDNIVDTGDGGSYWANDGTYKAVPSVDQVNGYSGPNVTLDADDIAETTDHNWLTDAEKTAIASNAANNHSHANESALDAVTDSGDGTQALTSDGTYSDFAASINGLIGDVNLTTEDVPEGANNKYLTPAERADIASNTTDRHSHSNKGALDNIIDSGDGTSAYMDDGSFKVLVEKINNKTGASVTLDASDIAETTDHNWLTDAEQAAIASNTTDRHNHSNKGALDNIIDSGDGTSAYMDDGSFKSVVQTVNGKAGPTVSLTGDDITETTDHNWLTDAEQAKVGWLTSLGDGTDFLSSDGVYRPAPVESINGYTGDPILDADDIGETTDRNWLTDAEKTDIASNKTDRHNHSNKSTLDGITNTGDGTGAFMNDGNYKVVVEKVNSKTGSSITLDASDIAETTDHNWLTDAEKTDIASNTSVRHNHSNKSTLDGITNTGDGTGAFMNDGNYKVVVENVNSKSGANVTLDADDIAETTDRNWLTDAEQTDIANNKTDRHNHSNKGTLDNIVNTGDGTGAFMNDGNYKVVIEKVNNKTGASITLDASDIGETTDHNWLTDAEKTDIASNASARHNHSNKSVLDNIVNTGDGSQFLSNDGTYKNSTTDAPVDSVNTYTGAVVLDADDIAETTDHNWLTDAEQSKVAAIDISGDGSQFLSSDGTYKNSTTNAPVDSVNTYTGAVVLDADDIAETTDRNWLTDAEQTDIASNKTDRHNHSNKSTLDGITNLGDGTGAFMNDGNYKVVIEKVNNKTGASITLDASDIGETTDHNWLTDAEKTDIANNKTDRHNHPNKSIIDNIVDTGDGTGAFMNDGNYKVVVEKVNSKTGSSITLDASDIPETTDHNWLTDAEQSKVAAIDISGDGSQFLSSDGTYKNTATDAPVDSVNTYTGAVVLDADDIAETTDRNWLTDAEQTDIANNKTDRHNHSNKSTLDGITNTGDGTGAFMNDGNYKVVIEKVNNKTGSSITLDAGDIPESVDRNWLTDAEQVSIGWLTNLGDGTDFLSSDGVYRPAPVESINGYTGAVVLDASDIAETTDRNWLTDAEQADIASNKTDRHNHSNKSTLDNITDTGDGSLFLANDGTYKNSTTDAPVDSVNAYTGAVVLDASDIAETTDRNWLTDAEQTNIANNTIDRHIHSNKSTLDNIVNTGDGTGAFMNDGNYKVVVEKVNNKTGSSVTLDASDIAETTDHNWLTDAEQTKVGWLTNTGSDDRFLAQNGVYELAPVTSVAGKTDAVLLDATDIAETTDKNWMSDGEKTKIGWLSNAGDGSQFLNSAGVYANVDVTSVAGKIGTVTLDAGDVAETTDRKWLTADERDDISNIPLWWPKTSPGDGTYTSFTVSGATVTFNT